MREYPLVDSEGQPLGKIVLDKPKKFETPPQIGFQYERLPESGELDIKQFELRVPKPEKEVKKP